MFDMFRKYTWAAALKDKKSITVTDAFQKFSDVSVVYQTKYGSTNVVNFNIEQRKHGYKKII